LRRSSRYKKERKPRQKCGGIARRADLWASSFFAACSKQKRRGTGGRSPYCISRLEARVIVAKWCRGESVLSSKRQGEILLRDPPIARLQRSSLHARGRGEWVLRKERDVTQLRTMVCQRRDRRPSFKKQSKVSLHIKRINTQG